MPLTYLCDTCGKQALTPPPEWVHLNITMQRPVPPPAAPVVETVSFYVCDLHQQDGILLVLHDALATLPDAKPPEVVP